MASAPLVGREKERVLLADALLRCRSGRGGVVLVSGEAGIGKTRLVDEAVSEWDGDVFRTVAVRDDAAYASLARFATVGEAGDPRAPEAVILDALVALARRCPTVVVLEDAHEADAATIELLGRADDALSGTPLLVLAVFRSDQLPRAHPIRALRAHLRRRNRDAEITVPPLTVEQTGAFVGALVGGRPDRGLVDALHERAAGVPFFVEELVWSLRETGCLVERSAVVRLSDQTAVPMPESVTDAVLARTAPLRKRHGPAIERAAVLGTRVDLVALAAMVPPAEADALLEGGLLVETDEGVGAFRHALVRDALHRAIPWARRRSLHEEAAHVLSDHGASPAVVAEHWDAAQHPERARPLWLAAAEQHCGVHAYRDAAAAARRALAHWPRDDDSAARLHTLTRIADCAELCGDYAAAADAWTDVATEHAAAGALREVATARRRIANAAELIGDRARALTARAGAAEGFEAVGLLGPAAEERLAMTQSLKAAGRLTEALEEAVAAGRAAEAAGEESLAALALTLEGATRAGLGEGRRGVEIARSGLERALAGQLTETAAKAYYELGDALEYAADYAAAVEAYESATELCEEHNLSELSEICFVCTSPVTRLMGDWDRVLEICAAVHSKDGAQLLARRVADEESGLVSVLRGDSRKARGPLKRAVEFGRTSGVFGIEVGATWGLAMVAVLDDDGGLARETAARLVERCAATEECHYALPALRWCATHLSTQTEGERVADVHRVLVAQTVRNASPKVLSTLAHAAAELAFVDGDVDQAESLMERSLDLLRAVTAPYEKALATLRWGELAAAGGNREAAVERLTSAYRTARILGAKPLASQCSAALASMGEPVEQRLGRVAARDLDSGGLTRREREVLGHLAQARTNKEIAAALFLSTRTVDMHVRNVLRKLGCSSRGAAVNRALERGWLVSHGPSGNPATLGRNYGGSADADVAATLRG